MTALDIIIEPTAERLRHANDNHKVLPTKATRTLDAPIDRLRSSGALSESQHAAALAYYADWYAAGLAPLGAVDYSRVIVDGSKPNSTSDYRFAALTRFNKSAGVLTEFFRETVNLIVLHEQSVERVGRNLGLNNSSQARAVAMDRLRCGLDLLAKRYRV